MRDTCLAEAEAEAVADGGKQRRTQPKSQQYQLSTSRVPARGTHQHSTTQHWQQQQQQQQQQQLHSNKAAMQQHSRQRQHRNNSSTAAQRQHSTNNDRHDQHSDRHDTCGSAGRLRQTGSKSFRS
eukprot:15476761-Alexandrium_andersonii.AAC.1